MLVRRTAVAAVVLAPFLVPSAAGAGDPAGLRCGYTVMADPRNPGWELTVLDAGPLVLDADPAGQPVRGSITCSVHLRGDTHSSAVAASATSGVMTGVVVLEPTPVSYPTGDADHLVLCTRVDLVGSGTYYWSPDRTGETEGSWSTDPDSSCRDDLGASPLRPVEKALDALVCPVLALAFPPQGDVEGIWDCPPYDS